ncbi:MAG: DegT/DnrJ/EryC1/StrS family aminotransferase, partial [Bacillota bacterium]
MNYVLEQNLHFYRGRIALNAILVGLGIGNGDEVITQAFTCVAVPESIIAAGALPVYVDIKKNGFNMDADDLVSKITSKTKAIIVQHTYGIPADMDRIMDIANEINIPIIEDCCHTFDSMYKGKKVGTFGVASFYSYEWGKPLVLGVGGSAFINDEKLYKIIVSNYTSYNGPSRLKVLRIIAQYFGYKLLYKPAFYWKLKTLFHFLSSLKIAEGNYYDSSSKNQKILADYNLKMSNYHKKLLSSKFTKMKKNKNVSQNIAINYFRLITSEKVVHPNINSAIKEIVLIRYPLITNNKSEILIKAKKQKIEISDWYMT